MLALNVIVKRNDWNAVIFHAYLLLCFAYFQREFLSTFPLFDCVGGGMTDKSVLWRFLLLGQCTSQLQPSIRPLLEKQVLERVSYLLRSRSALTSPNAATDWLLDVVSA
ncbi:unnamed protein product [Rodentolepis nana]|uniref:Secreted protein n=1 Tax=Rodentolepis nana TaxID=102285 RepID=A0A0R3THR3_RODNA|nr:unnamed protein product [Rodentolepis nana]